MKVYVVAALAVLALLGSALIVAKPWVTIRHAEPIAVKGYAELPIRADAGSIKTGVSSTGASNAEAYQKAGETLERVKSLIADSLGGDFELVELPSSMGEVNKLNAEGKRTNIVDYYVASRWVRVTTSDVDALETLGRALYDLNAEGITIYVDGPSFFVSDLDETKLKLVEVATMNGKERARLMAESSGEALGPLISARQGVIQITKENSTETSSYGMYDTETIDKVIKLAVTLEYAIKE